MSRILALVALALVACGSHDAFECMTSAQCKRGTESGTCVQNACGFPDPGCPSGYRFEPNAPGSLAGTCVTSTVDGGDTACGAIGQACCATTPTCTDSTCNAGACAACDADVALGRRFTCVLRSDHTIWCAGDNAYGQLGVGIAGVPSASRVQVHAIDSTLITDATAISAGRDHACALRANGSVWCWGGDYSGQLGDGATFPATGGPPPQPAAVQVVQTGGAPLTGIVEIEAGYAWTCGRDSTGAAWCWGDNGKGQLGDNTTSTRSTAAHVLAVAGTSPLTGVTDLIVGGDTACANTAANNVLCWGGNNNGQFGDGTLANHLRPVAYATTSSVAVGQWHMCKLEPDSTISCAGWAAHGRLGGGTVGFWDQTNHSTPNTVVAGDGSTFSGATKIVGGAISCALMPDKTVMCWGDNTHGQAGNGEGSPGPQKVHFLDGSPLTNVDKVVAKFAHVCAHRTTGEWLCWGRNGQGELADGSFVHRGFPIPLKGACP